MGDFNCRVGKATDEGDHIGCWGEPLAHIDAKGQALRTFLADNNLYALNGRSHPANGDVEYTWGVIKTHAQPEG